MNEISYTIQRLDDLRDRITILHNELTRPPQTREESLFQENTPNITSKLRGVHLAINDMLKSALLEEHLSQKEEDFSLETKQGNNDWGNDFSIGR